MLDRVNHATLSTEATNAPLSMRATGAMMRKKSLSPSAGIATRRRCELLKRNDYIILERNWSCAAGEADIIALDDGCLVFVEVKTRAGGDKGFPQEAVTPTKRARYERIAYSFLSTYDGVDARVRFDVIAIQAMPNSRGFVKHIVNAFGAGA